MNISSYRILSEGAGDKAYFMPSVAVLEDHSRLYCGQVSLDSDYYGAPLYCHLPPETGHTLSFTPIPGMESRPLSATGLFTGNADIRVHRIPARDAAMVIATTVNYTSDSYVGWSKEKHELPPCNPSVYAIFDESRTWLPVQILPLPGIFRDYRCSGQLAFLPGNRFIAPFYFQNERICNFYGSPSPAYSVITALYEIVGNQAVFIDKGNVLDYEQGRGFLEPTVLEMDGRFFMTLRAEDGHAYCSTSEDGLAWSSPMPWHWDDGSELEMSTTQQRWARIGNKAILLYTRKSAETKNAFRFRTMLYASEANPLTGTLLKSTEKVLFPIQEMNGVQGLYGNFHCAQFTNNHAIVTDAPEFFRIVDGRMSDIHTRYIECDITED